MPVEILLFVTWSLTSGVRTIPTNLLDPLVPLVEKAFQLSLTKRAKHMHFMVLCTYYAGVECLLNVVKLRSCLLKQKNFFIILWPACGQCHAQTVSHDELCQLLIYYYDLSGSRSRVKLECGHVVVELLCRQDAVYLRLRQAETLRAVSAHALRQRARPRHVLQSTH